MGFSLILLAAVPIALFGLHVRPKMSLLQRRSWRAALVVAIALGAAQLVTIAVHNVRAVPEWDFLGFWLNAHIAAAGHNVYDPSFARTLVAPFSISDDFRREIIDVGFWYPPPSIFVFLPLAAFGNPHVAYAFWYIIQAVALTAAILILAKTFLGDDGIDGILVVAALTLAFPAAASTVVYGQTNFLLLLALALFWRTKDRFAGGIWLGAAMLVKPFVGAFALALFVRRRFAPLGGTIALLAVSTAGSVALLGLAAFKMFLSGESYRRLPLWVYTESTNQSLLGVILRAMHVAPGGTLHLPLPYIVTAVALILTSAWLCLRAERTADDLALALCLTLGLLIYPTSQNFYAVVLVVPMLVIWQRRQSVPWRTTGLIALMLIFYAIMRVRNEMFGFAAYALLWLVLAAMTVRASADARAFETLRRIGEKRALTAVFVLAAATLIGHDVARPNAPILAPVGLDFRAFYCSGYAVDQGADPYRVEPLRACEHRVQPAAGWPDTFVIPSPLPGYGVAFFGLLARLPYMVAKDVWYLVMLASLLVTVGVLRRLSGLPLGVVILAVLLVDWWVPYHFGQAPVVAVAALCCAAALLTSGRRTAAALAAAVAMIEPHIGLPACLAMFAWLPRTRLALASCAVALAGISAIAVGPSLSLTYFTRVLPEHAAAELVSADQFSLSHLAHIAGLGDATALALGTLSYVAMTVVGVILARRVANALKTDAFIVLLPPAIALFGGPYLHDLQFAAAIPATLLLAATASRWRTIAWAALAIVSLPWYSLSHDRFLGLAEDLVALTAVMTFAAYAVRDMTSDRRRFATAAGFFAIFVALIGLAHLPQKRVNGATLPVAAVYLAPDALASANWGAQQRADPRLSTPTLQAEIKKVPFWLAILLLLAVAFRQTRTERIGLPFAESHRQPSEQGALPDPI